MSTTALIQARLDEMRKADPGLAMSAEARARALQAAYLGALSGRALNALGDAAAALYRHWRQRAHRKRTAALLMRLDDRLLTDIGLDRSMLHEQLRALARRPVPGAVVPPVETVIGVAAPAATAANQDRAPRRTAA